MGMLVVETVAKIRRDHHRGKPIKAIVRETGLSRNTVRKAVRAESAQFSYRRSAQPRPELGGFAGRLEEFLEANERAGKRDRLRLTRIHDLLQRKGFAGSYDAVRRYAKR
jgi:transposase